MTTIHFLNVGHGDCTIIEHASGHRTMIDINNGCSLDEDTRRELAAEYGISGYEYALKQGYVQTIGGSFRKEYLAEAGYDVELTDPVDYYKERWGLQPIFRYIQTHPNLDHMRGLRRLCQEGIQILNFWDSPNTRSVTNFTGNDKAEWDEYQRLRCSTSLPLARHVFVGQQGKYWNQDDRGGLGDGIHVLAPTRDVANGSATDDPNAHSYVLWLNYNGFKAVLGGDASIDTWERIACKYGANLKCNVLKASHHGRDSGFQVDAVKAMNPVYTIVSVGKKPSTDASNRYRPYTQQKVWSTRWRGNIVLTIEDDGRGTITPQYDRSPPPPSPKSFDFLTPFGNR